MSESGGVFLILDGVGNAARVAAVVGVGVALAASDFFTPFFLDAAFALVLVGVIGEVVSFVGGISPKVWPGSAFVLPNLVFLVFAGKAMDLSSELDSVIDVVMFSGEALENKRRCGRMFVVDLVNK